MIIRRINPDENGKLDALQAIAYGFSCDIAEANKGKLKSEVYGAFLDDNSTLIASIFTHRRDSWYCGKALPTVGIGGVATLPEYRRHGAVRAIFREIFRIAPENKWATSYLFPFSYAYYRKFGYERLDMILRIKLPPSALETFERSTSAKLYTGDKSMLSEILAIYTDYSKRYNMMFTRSAKSRSYSDNPYESQKWTYVWYDKAGKASSYATVQLDEDEGRLTVRELCYTNKEGLYGILGFLRMFDGQVHEYLFKDLPVSSELDTVLRRYIDVEYELESHTMGRVLLIEPLLKANAYPSPCSFRLRCEDNLDFNRAVWEVNYDGKAVKVTRHPYESEYDLSAAIPSLSRIMLCGGVDRETAEFMEGVTLTDTAEKVLGAFPKRRYHLHDTF